MTQQLKPQPEYIDSNMTFDEFMRLYGDDCFTPAVRDMLQQRTSDNAAYYRQRVFDLEKRNADLLRRVR